MWRMVCDESDAVSPNGIDELLDVTWRVIADIEPVHSDTLHYDLGPVINFAAGGQHISNRVRRKLITTRDVHARP
jgi:hypothetical protein